MPIGSLDLLEELRGGNVIPETEVIGTIPTTFSECIEWEFGIQKES